VGGAWGEDNAAVDTDNDKDEVDDDEHGDAEGRSQNGQGFNEYT
jgi:hypothetical protein